MVLLAHHPHAGGRAQLVATREGQVDAASALEVSGGALLEQTVAHALAHAQHLVGVRPRDRVEVRGRVRVGARFRVRTRGWHDAPHRYCELVDLLRDEEFLL